MRPRAGTRKGSAARGGSRPFIALGPAVRLLFATALAAGLVWLGVYESTDPRFALQSVEVTGTKRSTPTEIRQAAGLPRGSNVWLLDTAQAVKRIEQQPWVKRASITRAWPNLVRVEVAERVAVARLRLPASAEDPSMSVDYALVDADLRVLQVGPLSGADSMLPLFSLDPLPSDASIPGDDLTGSAAATALQAQQRLVALGVRADEIEVNAVPGLAIVVEPHIRVLLGSLDDLDAKVRVLRTIESRMPRTQRVRYVDIRSPNSPTVVFE